MSNILLNSEPEFVKKGTILLFKGDTNLKSYKVLKGCLRSYVIDSAGKEHILQFATEDWYITDLDGFVNGKPANIFIDALEDSEVICTTRNINQALEVHQKEALFKQSERLMRNVIALNKRLMLLLSSTAEERYLDFVETYPCLVHRLPLKLIASYIGITPEYLSEIRRKISKKARS